MVVFMRVSDGLVYITTAATAADADARRLQIERETGRPVAVLGGHGTHIASLREVHAMFSANRFGRTDRFNLSPSLAAYIERHCGKAAPC